MFRYWRVDWIGRKQKFVWSGVGELGSERVEAQGVRLLPGNIWAGVGISK